MSDVPILLEMRSITKEFPGVKALSDVNLDGARRRDPRDLRRERRRQVHADEGPQRGLPVRQLRRPDRLPGRRDPLLRHPGERERRHRDHPPGARAHPGHVDRGEHLPRQRAAQARRDRLEGREPDGAGPDGPGRPAGGPGHPGQGHRRRQAAAGGDRQGVRQGRQAAHPRRADRRAERGRLPAPAGPAARLPRARHHLDHDLAQAERDRGDRRPDHHPARRPDRRDAGRPGGRRRRGPDRAGHGRPRAEQPVPGPHAEDRRGLLRGPGLERPAPDLGRASGLQERELHRAPRRDRRIRRPDGRRPHRAGDERLRPLLRGVRVRARSSRTARRSC